MVVAFNCVPDVPSCVKVSSLFVPSEPKTICPFDLMRSLSVGTVFASPPVARVPNTKSPTLLVVVLTCPI